MRPLALVLGAWWALPVFSQDVSNRDREAIRAVISEQLEAFRRDDAEAAFAPATSGIRGKFGSAKVFLEMVRCEYPAVYRPGSVQFEAPEAVEGGALSRPCA